MTANTADPGVPTEPATAPADDVVDVEALKAAAAKLATLEAKLAEDKKADRDAKKRAQEAAEQAGKLAEALEAAKARLAELEGVEPLAAKWRTFEATESKRLDEEAKSLPDQVRALYSKAPDLDAKREVLEAFKALQPAANGAPAAKPPGPSVNMGAPPPSHEIDFAAAYKDPTAWAEAKRRDPKGAAAFIANAGRSPSLLSNLTGGLFGNRAAS